LPLPDFGRLAARRLQGQAALAVLVSGAALGQVP
jgi:hypothetical protein